MALTRMPDARLVVAVFDGIDPGQTARVGLAEPGRIDHEQVAQHPDVHIAAHRHDARLVENDRIGCAAPVQLYLAILGVRERVPVAAAHILAGPASRPPPPPPTPTHTPP